jgi:hypothetical protein
VVVLLLLYSADGCRVTRAWGERRRGSTPYAGDIQNRWDIKASRHHFFVPRPGRCCFIRDGAAIHDEFTGYGPTFLLHGVIVMREFTHGPLSFSQKWAERRRRWSTSVNC